MADTRTKNAKDFEKGFNAGGGNPFDFVYKMYQKVRGNDSRSQDQSTQVCPDCGQVPAAQPNPQVVSK